MFEGRPRQNSSYRSVRYSTIRKDSRTADPDQPNQFRIKRKPLQTTFYKTQTLDLKSYSSQQPRDNPQRYSYMQTFHSLLHSQRKIKQDDGLVQLQSKIKFSNYDVDFVKEDETEFTLLDPFIRPYTYLSKQIAKTQKQLGSQQHQVKCIRAQLNIMNYHIINSLKQSQQQGLKGFQKLRNLLKKNETNQSQRKMRVRRELTELYQQHDINKQTQNGLHNKVLQLQSDIFNCHPFQLQVDVAAQ